MKLPIKHTYTRISLKAFLRKTLGGFADAPAARPGKDAALAMYRDGEKVEVILTVADMTAPRLYRLCRRAGVELRGKQRKQHLLQAENQAA